MSGRIVAAGALLWRPGSAAGDEVEICVIHRPGHDDWSLPKGKLDPGEHVLAAAAREVHEETAHRVRLDRPLPAARYIVAGRRKIVYFWAARADDNAPRWRPNAEVDKVRFWRASKALQRLSHDDERHVVKAFLDDPRPTTPVVLLRHTSALARSAWEGDDARRPLTKSGRADAEGLIAPLAALGSARAISSDATRCAETLRPFAEARVVELELDPDLSEAAHAHSPDRARAVMRKIIADGRSTVVCSHRPVLPELLAAAAESAECVVPTDSLPAGGFHVLHIADGGTLLATDTHPHPE